MKVIIFGIGRVYHRLKHYFFEEKTEIVALVDNSRSLCGTFVDGYIVDVPEHIQQYQCDYIVITSAYAIEMRRQLIRLGVCQKKILHYRDYIGSIPVKAPDVQIDASIPNVLILSNDFGYHGGAMTCVDLACVLRQEGYGITIAVPSADQKFLEEVTSEKGIEIIVIENLVFMSEGNLEWANKYEYVFANTFVMIQCAVKLAQKRNVYLWLHESIDSYVCFEYWHDEIENGIENNQLMIGAVSDIARKNFLSVFRTEKAIELLPYGINDNYKKNGICTDKEIITFITVANFAELKGADVLLDALNRIPQEFRSRCRLLFVGKINDTEYGRLIRKRMDETADCRYLGELSREKLYEVYSETDIVIVPSRRDSLPLVATEAMMLKKPCIISDAVGTAAYIKHQYNGLIFKNEDREELAGAICWCLEHKAELSFIAENARETYERYFTIEKFRGRIKGVLELL